ncbi:MAG TPA: VIT1/CCC1 transporter family protein [Candidatus Dormibacteraeota bacterium]|nr:VIT1/CCC1 transporter family protein [Candidatus Dormibacteraeota bacterium]
MGSRPPSPAELEKAPGHPPPRGGVGAGSERERLARRTGIREVVFGVQDGLLTTLGLTTGVATATAGTAVAHTTILIAGLLGALAGMISMGTGAYLATTASRDLKHQAIHKERGELLSKPDEELTEMVAILAERGVPTEEATQIARSLARYPQLWEETHIEKELGISSQLHDAPVRDGFLMAGTFLVGAVVPILSYIFMTGLPAVLVSLALSGIGLAAVGVLKAAVTGQRVWVGGVQVLAVGGGAALAGYVFGVLLPHAFGLHLPPTA